ncbi:MAG: hypothetical protein ISR72_05045 [Methylobacter sp.]|nr:hypothetical protein [Planctomycetota bacterium]MBL6986406.1 hypothetical protein [Methylobacter sp.]
MIINWFAAKAQKLLPLQDADLDELSINFDFALSAEITGLLYAKNDDCMDEKDSATQGAVTDDCLNAVDTHPKIGTIEQCMAQRSGVLTTAWRPEAEQHWESLPRATPVAVAERHQQDEIVNETTLSRFALDEYELALA